MASVSFLLLSLAAMMALAAAQTQYPKIKMSSAGPFQIQKGFSQTVSFTLDNPIICNDPHGYCAVVVLITNPNPNDLQIDTCQVKWTNADWNQVRTITIKATETFKDDGEKTYVVVTKPAISDSEYYSAFDCPDITIKTQARPTHSCSATGDPHYTTFDGATHHEYGPGQMILYGAPWRNFEIQARVWNRPAVHCGLAAREGNNLITFNFCPGDNFDIKVQFNDPANQPSVSNGGGCYTVNFKSGAQLYFCMYGYGIAYYFNVYVTAPGMDYGKTVGMCGDSNGDPGNDYAAYQVQDVVDLLPSQKITSDLFAWVPPTGSSPPPAQPYSQECPYVAPVVSKPVLHQGDSEDITDILKKVQASGTVKPIDQYQFFNQPVDANTPTLSPVDKTAVAATCKKAIADSDLGKVCVQVTNFNIQTYVDNCILDLEMMLGDARFVTDAYNAMQAACAEIAGRDLSTWVIINGTAQPNPLLTAKLCLNGCSGHGTCNNGTCVCAAGFKRSDCSLDSTKPPTAAALIPSRCDAQSSVACPSFITVTGIDFDNSSTLVCKIGNVLVNATFATTSSVYCTLPANANPRTASTSLAVSVSNDGKLFSTSTLNFIWYDSVCHVCNDSGSCVANNNSCVISGSCYRQGDASASNPCQTCQPAVSKTAWSTDISNGFNCGPVFDESQYTVQILDVTAVNTQLTTVHAANKYVSESVSNVVYSIGANSNPAVDVDSKTGKVFTKTAINPASINVLTFNARVGIVATDAHGNVASTAVFLSLQGTNRAPVFAASQYNFSVTENTAIGTFVGFVNASDPNAGQATAVDLKWDVFTFSWIMQEVGFGDTFAVNNVTGVITTLKNIDYEQKALHSLSARAIDGGGLFSAVPVYIQIKNVNEAPTAVTLSSSTVAENSAAGTVVGTLSTVDPDSGDSWTYRLITTGSPFAIQNGKVVVSGSLDFETKASYSIVIQTVDSGSLGLNATVVITVTDVNEAPSTPTITIASPAPAGVALSGSAFTLKETLAILTPFATVTSTDVDAGQTVTCGISGSSVFQISGNQLLLASALDAETTTSLSFNVACSDSFTPSLMSAVATFTVTVTDENESGQNVHLVADVTIPENAAAGTVVGVISATDPDTDASTLTFSTPADDHFMFTSATPVCTPVGTKGAKECRATLVVRGGLDFETKPIDNCRVITVDNHGLSSTNTVPIKIGDVNEGPTGIDLTNNVVMEHAPTGTLVGSVLIIDPDQTASSYSVTLVNSAQGRFSLRKSASRRATGGYTAGYDLLVADGSSISYNTNKQLTVVLSVTDQGTPSFTAQFNVVINVQDRPLVPVLTTTAPLSVTTTVGRKIATLSLDGLDRSDLIPTYAASGAQSSYLTLVASGQTANVLLSKALTGMTSLTFTVVAVFNDSSVQPVQKDFTLAVDTTNQAPSFPSSYPAAYVRNDDVIGTSVVTVQAIDPEGSTVTYSMTVSPSTPSMFKINSATGEVTTLAVAATANVPLRAYTLTISASDGSSSTSVTVTANVVDDCASIPNQDIPCSGNGQCTDGVASYTCDCDAGFTGSNCENIDISVTDPNASTSSSSISGGAVAGIVVGVIVLIILIALLALVLLRSNKNKQQQATYSSAHYASQPSAIGAVDRDGQAVVRGESSTYEDPDLHRVPQSDFEPGVSNPIYSWYQPQMSRQECEDYLSSQGEGAFVIRDSSFTPGWHMLGIKTNNAVVHERIKLHADGTYELLPSSNAHQPNFRGIPELVEHYASCKRPGVSFALALDNPLYDNHLLRETKPIRPVMHATEVDAPKVPQRYSVDPNADC